MNRLVDSLIMLFLLPIDSKGTHHSRMYMYFSYVCEFHIDFHLSQTIDEAEVNKNYFAQDRYVHLTDKFVVPA
jgi:hypothetical protein